VSADTFDQIRLFVYRLATAGKKNSFDAKNAQIIKLRSATYNSASDTVVLTPKQKFAITKTVQLRVNGQPPSGLQDCADVFVDGDHDGQPGGNVVALLRRGGVNISTIPLIRSSKIPLELGQESSAGVTRASDSVRSITVRRLVLIR
jgi:hypothetical protein